jgi:hypothetical protein
MPLFRFKQNRGEFMYFPAGEGEGVVGGSGVHYGQMMPHKRETLRIAGLQYVGVEGKMQRGKVD